jgi:hypothetical protein
MSMLASIADGGSSVNVAGREGGAVAPGIDAVLGAASGSRTAFRGKNGSRIIASRITEAIVNPRRVGVQNLVATRLWLRLFFGELIGSAFPSIQ